MPFEKIAFADAVITRLIENQGLYQLTNRSYDSLVQPGATSVRRQKLASLVVKKNTGTSPTSADRKKLKNATTMVDTALDVYSVPLAAEAAAHFESNDQLRRDYEVSAAMALMQQFDADVIAAAQATSQVQVAPAGDLTWKTLTLPNKLMNVAKVPKEDRVVVVSANLEDQFMNIDVIKNAASFNLTVLNKGKFVEVLNMKFFISGLVEQIGGKDNIVGYYAPGLAFILSKTGEWKEAWDGENLQDNIDLLAHAAAELDGDEFAAVVKMP